MLSDPVCDTCGGPIRDGDARYSVADRFDDDGHCTHGRHWDCHTPMDVALARLRTAATRAEAALRDVDSELHRRRR